MSKFIPFGKIGQFRNTVKNVNENAKYDGVALPTLSFTGTVKLHGTNAAVGYDPKTGEIWVQSRNNIITPENDNAGFAKFVEDKKDVFLKFFQETTDEPSIIYGEWCGQGIQKGVAVSQLERMFVIFQMKNIVSGNVTSHNEILRPTMGEKVMNDEQIFFIDQFGLFTIKIDFSCPSLVQNELVTITNYVEEECPVGKWFGVKGIGEGVVWEAKWITNDPDCQHHLIFKVKGEKHSSSKVKKLASVDPETIESIKNFVDYACTENRLEQALGEVGLAQENIGKFIGWINKDINKEEGDVLEKNGLTMKQVGKNLSTKARNWYLDKLNMD